MAISVNMQARQSQQQKQGMSQSLTMTPQLVQSIKLLQMSSVDLLRHIEEEVEKNPLLELADDSPAPSREDRLDSQDSLAENAKFDDNRSASDELDTSQSSLEEKLGTSLENEFDTDRSGGEQASASEYKAASLGTDFSIGSPEGNNLEEYVEEKRGLKEHLNEQLSLSRADPKVRKAACEIIDQLDEDGFFRHQLHKIAVDLQMSSQDAEAALALVQSFDPVGIACRDLSECLAIQLREKNRLDPAMQCLINNLELLAKRDFESLEELCGVGLDDLLDMVDEIKALEPRPARAFDTTPVQNIIPEIYLKEMPDGSFAIELNPDTMPKVLINQAYSAVVSTKNQRPEEKAFMTDCLQSANWLVRSLEQRANTILKVMAEIVRQQDGFFAYGISHLRPLSLKQVADEINMHESTVSRVTSNKYVETNRGIFELKFFFTASIGGTNGEDAHSAEAVRQRIKKLIETESAQKVLSDDALVDLLKAENIDIARRTVAKYRENMGFASSVQRRREKKAQASRR
ncbi:MAG: RNA polymerase factor sigma-54 [Salaquimonas sp.]